MNLRLTLAFLFLALGLGTLVLSWQTFSREAHLKPVQKVSPDEDQVQLSVRELESLFPDSQVKQKQFAVIASNNLFSQKRKEWAPPPPKPEKKKPEPEPEPEPEKKEPPPPDSDRDDVALYGTYLDENSSKAILFFKRFQQEPRTRLVQSGETVRDDAEKKDGLSYRIESIEQQEVTLKDDKGIAFTVGLYDHERSRQRRAAAKPKKSIVVSQNSKAESSTSSSLIGKSPAQDKSSASRRREQKMLKTVRKKSEILKLPQEEKDRLVQEGKLQKIDTPFGVIYEPKN